MSKRLNKDLIKNKLSLNDIKKVVNSLGGDCQIEGHKIVCQTICHNTPSKDNSYKLYYYDNNKIFHCYTHCEDPTFDIFELVKRAIYIQTEKELTFTQSINYVLKIVGHTVEDYQVENNNKIDDYFDYDNFLNISEEQKINVVECPQLENLPTLRIIDWEKEFISFETLKKFHIKYDGYRHKIIIPHYNEGGYLVGVRGRNILEEDIERGKYMPVKFGNTLYNHPLGYNLYGLNINKSNIQNMKRIVLVESEKSVMQIDGYMDNISVAVCGSNVTQWQINKILELGIEEVILSFDKEYYQVGDNEYWKYYKKLKKITDKIKNYIKISVIIDYDNLLDYKDSPSDKGKEVFFKLLEKRSFVNDKI